MPGIGLVALASLPLTCFVFHLLFQVGRPLLCSATHSQETSGQLWVHYRLRCESVSE